MDDTPGAREGARGFDADANPPTRPAMPAHALRMGTRLRDYEILSLLGEGGFGIVYLALDVLLERQVAIKEYLPSSIAWRAAGSLQVQPRSPKDEKTFALGLRSFVNEARLLARFDHPSLLKVHRFWEDNGTAYMVMPFYEGRTLQRTLEKLGRRPTEAELRAWLAPLMDALQVLHAAKCYHRDISPDNILITPAGPMLLDFGAARRVIGDVQRALTVVLKPGFAPIEQYGESPGMQQGAWTDIYALAGVLFAAITSRRPLPAVSRLMEDRMPAVSEAAAGHYSASFLHAIDRGLALRPQDRPQSIAEFRALLDGLDPPPAVPSVASATMPLDAAVTTPVDLDLSFDEPTLPPAAPPPPASRPAPAAAATAATPRPQAEPRPATTAHAARAPTSPRQRMALIVAALALLALVGLLWSLNGGEPSRQAAEAPAPQSPPTAPLESTAPAPTPVSKANNALPGSGSVGIDTSAAQAPASAMAAPSTPQPSPPDAAAPAAGPPLPTSDVRPDPAPVENPPAAPPRSPGSRTPASVMDGAQCSDILKKGSLEPLTPAETAYLKSHCR